MKEITEKEALSRMASYCSASERCRQEVVERLRKWELPDEAIERIVETLLSERYIDEDRYCRSYINDKIRFSKWGKRKIAMALRQKDIPSELVREWLGRVDEEEYLSLLCGLLESKKKSVRASSDYEFRGKLIRFALGRGFDMEDIEKVLSV